MSYHCDCPDDRIGQHCEMDASLSPSSPISLSTVIPTSSTGLENNKIFIGGVTSGGIAIVMVLIISVVSLVVILRKKKTESNSTQSSPTLDKNADYEGLDVNTLKTYATPN
ncbi:uncharacterized protein LOC144357792 [Saccoglossus kowalevskii]